MVQDDRQVLLLQTGVGDAGEHDEHLVGVGQAREEGEQVVQPRDAVVLPRRISVGTSSCAGSTTGRLAHMST